MLAVRAADWPLLTGGRYSEVAVRTGLTVCKYERQKKYENSQLRIR
jgi:hypothetical protein